MAWRHILQRWHAWRASRRQAHIAHITSRRAIDPHLWRATLAALPYLTALSAQDQSRLRQLSSLFLEGKEFSGAQGMQITDAHAVMVAAQACLPILHIAPPDRPDLALAWYDGFVGIVLHPSEVKAKRAELGQQVNGVQRVIEAMPANDGSDATLAEAALLHSGRRPRHPPCPQHPAWRG
ncbi:MAG: hypothetical protein EAZ40_12370 [Rhodobacterales bacterium]|nr:MAG: hypothetical protein EAZ40_12370 [Rhodobacterales bacterium]